MQNIEIYEEDGNKIQILAAYYDTGEADIIATLLEYASQMCFPEFFAE